MDKHCSTCGETRPLSEFNVRRAAPDGLQSRCRACSRAWYVANRETHRRNVKANSAAALVEKQEQLRAYLVAHPCLDCGQTDLRTLEFDHREGVEKLADVTTLVCGRYAWRHVVAEIAKCDVVCASCHRVRTVQRAGTYREPAEQRRRAEVAAAATARLERLFAD